MNPSDPALGMGAAFTYTKTESITLHLPSVAVTKYWVVTVGLATGLGIVILLKPAAGLQAYCVAFDVSCIGMEVPLQIVLSACGVIVKLLVRPTLAFVFEIQPLLSLTVME